jgi:tRNA-dihydrouridine synthase A
MKLADSAYRLSVAPMMDVTDRHCRYFLRTITRHTRLYTEMVTTGALLHGDADRHLRFDPAEHPLALQLGGSEPAELARCAQLAARYGYDEVNLNVGCPSERVQRGAFGACLMAEPALVADCVRAMADASPLPVTVKHRIGIDDADSYAFVRDFVGTVAAAGCRVFIVHARNAVLKGLSPRENREIPPLRYEVVHRLKRDFPDLVVVINGGFTRWVDIDAQFDAVDGVMVGRAAANDPWMLSEADRRVFGDISRTVTRDAVLATMRDYALRMLAQGVHLRAVAHPLMGLLHGRPAARKWRRMLSDARELAPNDPALFDRAACLLHPPEPGAPSAD